MATTGRTRPILYSRAEIAKRHHRKCEKTGHCRQCKGMAVPGKTLCRSCARKAAFIGRCSYLRIKRTVILRQGKRCACCKETDIRLLTLDHKNNDGSAERAEIAGIFYRELYRIGKKRKDLQVLCYNCNFGRARNGGICPHKSPLSWKAEDHPTSLKVIRVVMEPNTLKLVRRRMRGKA